MAVASGEISARRPPLIRFVWILPAAFAILLYLFRDSLPWAATYPNEWRIPIADWIGVTATVAITGYVYGGPRLALGTGFCFLYLAVFGQWDSAMLTLALVLIALPLGVLIGLAIGIWGYRQPAVNRWLILPLLDIGQATPQFAYLVPMLMLFGNNPSSALLATLAFAVPPMVRATVLALQQVPAEIQ
jgi:glycine betaine/proline transport system permease protein